MTSSVLSVIVRNFCVDLICKNGFVDVLLDVTFRRFVWNWSYFKNITLMKPCEKRNSLFYIRIE